MRTCFKSNQGRWFANFISNILGIIIGIALTFGVSFLIQRREEKKQLQEMIILIKQELKENKEGLSSILNECEHDYRVYCDFTMPENEWSKIPKDSLVADIMQFRKSYYLSLMSNAWSIFQYSGMAQKFHKLDVITRLSECYYWLNKVEIFWNQYIEEKGKAANNHSKIAFEIDPYRYLKALRENEVSMDFIENCVVGDNETIYQSMPGLYREILIYTDFVLQLIDESGDYNYDAKDYKNEYENFKKNHNI